MNEEAAQVPFELIAAAGESKSHAMLAIEACREFEFEKAEEYLKQASQSLSLARKSHFGLIQDLANGKDVDVNLLLVHAEDHLTSAIVQKDMATEFLHLYKIIQELKVQK